MKPADFLSFDKFLAPILIKIVYWIGLVFIVLGFIASFGTMAMFGMGGAMGIIMALIGAILGALIWRLICEVWLVIFSINDRLGNLSGATHKP